MTRDRASEITGDSKIARPTRLDAQSLEQFQSIYLDSFPPSQQCAFGYLVSAIEDERLWLYIATMQDKIAGFGMVLPNIASGVHLLEYLAVARGLRGQGIGSRLLASIITALSTNRDAAGVLLEVESPDDAACAGQDLRNRRIAFYIRNGALPVECAPDYRVPNLAEPGTLSMRLMWLPLDGSPAVSGARLQDCLIGIYTKSYDLPIGDPLVQAALRDLVC